MENVSYESREKVIAHFEELAKKAELKVKELNEKDPNSKDLDFWLDELEKARAYINEAR
jgi:predicted alpha/beta hydrolase family esterase